MTSGFQAVSVANLEGSLGLHAGHGAAEITMVGEDWHHKGCTRNRLL